MRKTAVRVAMRMSCSIEYLKSMTITSFLELVEDIVAVDEEQRRKRRK